MMAHVDEIGVRCLHTARKSNSLFNGLMAGVWFKAQPVDDERFHTFQKGEALVWDGFHVGDVGRAAETIAHDGQLGVHHHKRKDFLLSNTENFTGTHGM